MRAPHLTGALRRALALALAALAMAAAVLLAALPPALRSARVDPMTALREH